MPKEERPSSNYLNKAYKLCVVDYFKYFYEEDFDPKTTHIDFYAFRRKLEEKYYMVAQKDFEEDFGDMSPLPRLLHGYLGLDILKLFVELNKIIVY